MEGIDRKEARKDKESTVEATARVQARERWPGQGKGQEMWLEVTGFQTGGEEKISSSVFLDS